MKDKSEDWEFLQYFVFKCLESTLSFFCISTEGCPSWLRSILRLPIFPITTQIGSSTIQYLSETIFVPDSELLNPLFQNKVDILDFGENHIWDITTVLRCSVVGLKFISDYNKPETMAIRIGYPVIQDNDNMGKVQEKKDALTRYLSSGKGN